MGPTCICSLTAVKGIVNTDFVRSSCRGTFENLFWKDGSEIGGPVRFFPCGGEAAEMPWARRGTCTKRATLMKLGAVPLFIFFYLLIRCRELMNAISKLLIDSMYLPRSNFTKRPCAGQIPKLGRAVKFPLWEKRR